MTINPPGSVPKTPDHMTTPSQNNPTNSQQSGHTQASQNTPAATVEISSGSHQTGKHNHQQR